MKNAVFVWLTLPPWRGWTLWLAVSSILLTTRRSASIACTYDEALLFHFLNLVLRCTGEWPTLDGLGRIADVRLRSSVEHYTAVLLLEMFLLQYIGRGGVLWVLFLFLTVVFEQCSRKSKAEYAKAFSK